MSTTTPSPGTPGRPPGSGTSWRRLLRMARPRATRANALATLLAVGLGFALVTQVRQTQTEGLDQLREDELVRVLDQVSENDARMQTELRRLEAQRDRLASGQSADAEALAAARERVDTLGVLAGTVPAHGPGITVSILDPQRRVTAPMLLDALEELRDAGAEAVQIGPVRVVASSYFTDVDGGVAVSGTRLRPPYVFTALGDPATMASAMDIPGGVTEQARRVGASATVRQSDNLTISALHDPAPLSAARPAPTATPSSR